MFSSSLKASIRVRELITAEEPSIFLIGFQFPLLGFICMKQPHLIQCSEVQCT